jgi:hypothetical protein
MYTYRPPNSSIPFPLSLLPTQLLYSSFKPTSQTTDPIITSKQSAEATTNVRILLESHTAHKLYEKPNEYLNIHTMYSLWGQLQYLAPIRFLGCLQLQRAGHWRIIIRREPAWLSGGVGELRVTGLRNKEK